MTSKLQLIAICAVLFTLSTQQVDARRRSRIDLPIKNAADAPLEDNLATASGSDVVVEKFELPPSSTTTVKALKVEESTSSEESSDECKSDNISFELITG
jgi:hypothetical protein